MRFLVDESLSAGVSTLLRMSGHDAVHLGDLDLLGAPDEDVMAAATREQRILLSADTDFGQLLAIGRHPGPSVVLFRRTAHRAEVQVGMLLANLATVEDALRKGAVVVITGEKVRFRSLPIYPER